MLDEELPAGESLRTWIASDAFRRSLAGGMYFLRVDTPDQTGTRMIVSSR